MNNYFIHKENHFQSQEKLQRAFRNYKKENGVKNSYLRKAFLLVKDQSQPYFSV